MAQSHPNRGSWFYSQPQKHLRLPKCINLFPVRLCFLPFNMICEILHLLLSYAGVCFIRKHLSCGLNGGSLRWRVLIPVICGGSTDTSRCVAEKKYTEQQAKKLFPQVFVPVCNPDGTYSEVTKNTLQDGQVFHEWLLSLLAFNLELIVHAKLIPGAVPQLHWVLLVRHPQWSTHQWFSSGQQKTSMSRSVKPMRSLNMCTILTGFLFYDRLDVWHFKSGFCNYVKQYIPYLRGGCNTELCGNVVSNWTERGSLRSTRV